jgi:hypothetical protein
MTNMDNFTVITGSYKHIAACAIPSGNLWQCCVFGNPYTGNAVWEFVEKASSTIEGMTTIKTKLCTFSVPDYWMVPILMNDNSNGAQN